MALTPKRLFLYRCISISLLLPYTLFSRSPLVNKTLYENACELEWVVLYFKESYTYRKAFIFFFYFFRSDQFPECGDGNWIIFFPGERGKDSWHAKKYTNKQHPLAWLHVVHQQKPIRKQQQFLFLTFPERKNSKTKKKHALHMDAGAFICAPSFTSQALAIDSRQQQWT